jgi:ubiquinone/menaquinone biosynthesis C-methylase UbiE
MNEKQRDFNKDAASWDNEPRRVKLAADVAEAIMREVDLSRDMDLLDYGCGTGLLCLQLQTHVRSVTGVDTSLGMLEALSEKVRISSIDNVRAVFINPEEEWQPEGKFHLIVSSMTMHHIRDVEALFNEFYRLLFPGGKLCIADLDLEDGSFHDDIAGVAHFGFGRRQMLDMLGRAGFQDMSEVTAAKIVKEDEARIRREYPVFLMTAVKRHHSRIKE